MFIGQLTIEQSLPRPQQTYNKLCFCSYEEKHLSKMPIPLAPDQHSWICQRSWIGVCVSSEQHALYPGLCQIVVSYDLCTKLSDPLPFKDEAITAGDNATIMLREGSECPLPTFFHISAHSQCFHWHSKSPNNIPLNFELLMCIEWF